MKKSLLLSFFIGLFLASINLPALAQGTEAITIALAEQMELVNENEKIRINITLAERVNTTALLAGVKHLDKETRRNHVIQSLQDFTALSQAAVLGELDMMKDQESVSKIKAYWVANVINCEATPEAIEALSSHRDILSIDHDELRIVFESSEGNNDPVISGNKGGGKEITWNVLKVSADEVWELGFDGEGVIVAVIDTGVNYDHYDLEDHMWESEDYPNHGWDFFYDDDDPKDEHGHGTHCAGTVAGDGTSGSQTGVAPEAMIMACKVANASGGSSEAYVWDAVEFSIENGAHVISLSMGWQHEWGTNRVVWRETFDAVLAAGMIASVAAGNEGQDQASYPIPDNVRSPGDCPPPWTSPDQTLTGGNSGVVCVGSTTSSDGVSGFSSRGPSTWEDEEPYSDYAYNPDIGLIRPDVSAPGSNIKSLQYSNNIGYTIKSGTSMAAPCNAGLIALLLSKNPALTPEQISQILEETTEVLVEGKNNNSGAGRVNALAAIEAASFPGPSYYSHVINDEDGNNDSLINPGESILLTMSIGNFSEDEETGVSVKINTISPYITFTDSVEYFGDFIAEDVIEIEDAFAFDVAENIPGGETITFMVTTYNDDDSWGSDFSEMAYAVNLAVTNFEVDDYEGDENGGLDPGETADLHIETTNTGQLDAQASMAYLTSLNGIVTVNNASYDLEDIAVGESNTATFNVTVNENAPTGISVEFIYEAMSGFFSLEMSLFAKIGAIVEDFETGDFDQNDWQFDGDEDWEITENSWEGTYAAKSGGIGNLESSELILEWDCGGDDSIAFQRKVSSEGSYDFLIFYIDGSMMDQWSGEQGWQRVAYPVSSGTHTFKWIYEKDWSATGGSDEAIIDYIELPAGADETLGAFAGPDDVSCMDQDFQTNGIAQNYDELEWATSGTGIFENEMNLNTVYYPSDDDYAAGTISLSLSASASGFDPVSDTMQLTFVTMPGAADNITGPAEVCNGTTESYDVSMVTDAITYNWVLEPAEAGVVNGDENTISIDWDDDFIGEVTLTVQGMNDCGGGDFSGDFNIMVDECSGIGDQSRQQFSINPNPNNGSFTVKLNEGSLKDASIKMVSLTGKVVLEEEISNSSTFNIQNNDLENGVYFLIIQGENTQMVEKVVIQK